MIHVNRCVIIGLIILVVTSCSPATSTAQPPKNTTTAPFTTVTIVSTVSPTLPASTLAEAQPTPVSSECFGEEQNLPGDIAGSLVLSGDYYLYNPALIQYHNPTYIFVPNTGDKIDLPVQGGSDFSVSPDKQWLAYYVKSKSLDGTLVVVGNDGKLFNKYPVRNWWGIQKWIDDGRLLVTKFSPQNPFPTLVFNAFTGKIEQELPPIYPEIFSGARQGLYSWNRYQLPETIYNTDLSLVIYPTDTTINNPRRKIILWDIKAGKVLNEIIDTWSTSRTPLWLNDQQAFVVNVSTSQDINRPNQDELMLVGIDGQVKQLTHLRDLGYQNVSIQPDFSESADGRFIAFWFFADNQESSLLGIYDMAKESIKVLCINIGGYVTPVWSPSGHQLLIDGTFNNLDNYGTIFVDVEQGILAQVEKGVIPVEWLVTP